MTADNLMTNIWWESYLRGRLAEIEKMLATKAKEYANDDDRMHNFNRATDAAAGRYESREGAIFGMMLKHWTSILDILDANDVGSKTPIAMIQEKFGDMINYLLLLEASITQTQHPRTFDSDDSLPF